MTTIADLADRIERALTMVDGPAFEDARLALAEWREREARLAGQEPVAWQRRFLFEPAGKWSDWEEIRKVDFDFYASGASNVFPNETRALYAAPIPERARVVVTDELAQKALNIYRQRYATSLEAMRAALEAALGAEVGS